MGTLITWAIRMAVVVAIVSSIIFAYDRWREGVYTEGYTHGVDAQKATDQVEFDRIERDITEQKAQANALYQSALADIVKAQAANDQFKTQLEKAREINRSQTNDIARRLAGQRLRFAADPPAQAAGCGAGGGGAASSPPEAPRDASPAACVVSAAVDTALKSIVFDADTLRDDYKLLFEWAHRDD
jgi:hypothetical protein